MTENKLLYGFDEALSTRHALKAGPVSVLYENGAVRYIEYGHHEIIRIIYIAVRDKNWGTHAPIIEDEKIISDGSSFQIEYTCRYEENNQTIFTWQAKISGDKNGKIVFTAHGETINDLLKNRSGFCVLHPIRHTAGEKLVVTHSDMSEEKTQFPKSISPFVPVDDITKLQWANNGHDYVLEMKGDIFEMEDHRNWTDTSFKTYCTPLSLPFPVQLKKGDTVDQEIIFYPLTDLPTMRGGDKTDIDLLIDESASHPLPLIGTEASTEIDDLSQPGIDLIKKIKPPYYGIEVAPIESRWESQFLNEAKTATSIQTDLFIKLKLGDDYEQEFKTFADIALKNKISPKFLLIIGRDHHFTPQPMIDWASEEIKKIFPSTELGVGTETNFTELNRNRRDAKNVDFVSYAIHPQEHAFDNLSLIENLESQWDTVQTAKKIYPGKKIFVSPVTLRRRLNPYAHHAKDRVWTNEQKNDPRQLSLFNAGWLLGSIKYLGESGANGISYFQTAGKQGIMDESGQPYPVAILLENICRLKNATIIHSSVNDPLQCSSLLLKSGKEKLLFLANHTNNVLKINLPFTVRNAGRISLYPSSMQPMQIQKINQLELSPYDIVMANA